MIVTDTHSFLWWLGDDPRLSATARERMDHEEIVIVPAIVCWEIALLVERGRITLDTDPLTFLKRALSLSRIRLEPLTPEIAVRANSFGDTLHRARPTG